MKLLLAAAIIVVMLLAGCEFIQRIVDSAGGTDKVIETGFKLAELVVPWPFDILLPGVASLVTALLMKNEEPA